MLFCLIELNKNMKERKCSQEVLIKAEMSYRLINEWRVSLLEEQSLTRATDHIKLSCVVNVMCFLVFI